MDAEHKKFLIDHISGISNAALAEKYHLTLQSVVARIRWAKEKNEFEGLRVAVEEEPIIAVMELAGQESIDEGKPEISPSSMPPDPKRKRDKSAEEISKLLSSIEGKNIARQESGISKQRVRAHEMKKGKPDPVFRSAMEDRRRRETWRRLGISVQDIRKMRGIN